MRISASKDALAGIAHSSGRVFCSAFERRRRHLFLERRTVSRKTPGDGRLEITKSVAQRLESLGPTLVIDTDGDRVRGTIGTFACTCRGESNPHVHYFLEGERLKQLAAGSEVDLELDEASNRVILRSVR